MAFAGSTALRLISDSGFQGGGPRLFEYSSSDGSTDIGNISGYFSGQGRSFNSSIAPNSGQLSYGDIVINRESSAGVKPQRVTFHAVNASTLNSTSTSGTYGSTFAYDASVSLSSTG